MSSAQYCRSCQARLSQGSRFCQSCGLAVSDERVSSGSEEPVWRPSGVAEVMEGSVREHLRVATAGKYEIVKKIGQGGMAVVYQAEQPSLNRMVAIKVMSDGLHDADRVKRFLREARAAANLEHPHIIPIYDVDERGGLPFIVMQFVAGQTLEKIITNSGPLPISLVETVLAHVGSALAYAHSKETIHRDIKPSNIMVDEHSRAIVMDFGIAKVQDTDQLTKTGAAIGTPAYMSPEQHRADVLTGASDQFSLGVVAYEMLTGRPPFEATDVLELFQKVRHQPHPPIRRHRPDCPRYLVTLVDRMLKKVPEERWPSLHDTVSRVSGRHPSAEVPEQTDVIDTTTSATRLTSRGRRMTFAAAVVVAVAVGGSMFAITRGGDSSDGSLGFQGEEFAAVPDFSATENVDASLSPPDTSDIDRTSNMSTSSSASGTSTTPRTSQPAAPPPRVSAPVTQPTAVAGELRVQGLPPFGRLTINGRSYDSTVVGLEPGVYSVRMDADGFEADLQSVTVESESVAVVQFAGRKRAEPTPNSVAAEQTESSSIAAPASGVEGGVLQVRIVPWANVTVDGVLLGRRTRFADTLRAGVTHVLRFQRSGFQTIDTTLTLDPGEQRLMQVRLRPNP